MSARFANPKRRCSSLSEIPRKKMQIFWRHFIQTLKTLIQFIFSHIGLTGSVVAYSIVGGWIFMGLEAPHELKLREQISTIRNHYVKLILNASEMHENNWNEENSLENITYEYITRFEKEIVQFIDGTGWNGLGDETELQWSYAGALLYSVTVITTIGYGHIAPKTDWGRIVTIVYAIFGIPLTLLCLRTIGSLMAGTFKFIYFHICYRLYLRWQQFRFYVRRKRQEHKRRIEKARMAFEELFEKGNEIWRSTEMLFTNGNEEENKEKGNEDMSFNLKSKKDLQNQEFQKDRNANRRLKYQRMKRNQKQMRTAAATMGTAAAGTATAAVETAAVTAGTAAAIAAAAAGTAAAGPSSESTMEVNRFIGNQFFAEEPENIDKASDIETLELRSGMEPQSPASSSQSKRKKLQQQQRVPDDCEPLNRVPQVRVPILISLLVISAYIFLGAVLFSLWEKNWDYLISSYFCFVTLSTIGFGDFVPGSEVESWSSAEKQAICTLYLLFGMAMIAMCFNLIQQEIILKFTDFGLRIGLIEERRLSMRLEEQSTD